MQWAAQEYIRKNDCGLNSKLSSTTNTQIESSWTTFEISIESKANLRWIFCQLKNYLQPPIFSNRNQSSDTSSHGIDAKFLLSKLFASDLSYDRKSTFIPLSVNGLQGKSAIAATGDFKLMYTKVYKGLWSLLKGGGESDTFCVSVFEVFVHSRSSLSNFWSA